ncbi:hypothetical protein [Bradyrhizobium sp. LTSPM299]|uniref:hypothetical protein n=1 Tax=Bradyrhizobium sp. LTSPM299 TaxID=1619233 RepID=UPI0012E12D61|nr:hypothetical protein [Bradyrhizobium sp. LTSPM299]
MLHHARGWNSKASFEANFEAGVPDMKHVSLPAMGVTPVTLVPFGRRRKGLFASILDALHHSRQAQARRVIKRYQHLIDRAERRRAELEGHDNVGH